MHARAGGTDQAPASELDAAARGAGSGTVRKQWPATLQWPVEVEI